MGFQFTGNNRLGNHIRHRVTNHMTTQPLPVLGIKNDFYKAFCVAGSLRLAVRHEGKLTYNDVIACFFCRFLRTYQPKLPRAYSR